MTNALSQKDVIDLIYTSLATVGDDVMNIVTAIFAYVVCTFLVGVGLSRALAVLLTICYSVFFLPPFIAIITRLQQVQSLASYYIEQWPTSFLANDLLVYSDLPLPILTGLPLVLIWIVSIVYMHHYVRSPHAVNGAE